MVKDNLSGGRFGAEVLSGGMRRDRVNGRILAAQGALRVSPHFEPGVIGTIVECPDASDWCRVAAGAYDGWLQRRDIWGVYDNEVVR